MLYSEPENSIIGIFWKNFDTLIPIFKDSLYHFVTHLSWVLWIADSAQMSNKTITAVPSVYLQNDSSISLEWSFQWNTGIVLQVNCCYHFDMKWKEWNTGMMIITKRCFSLYLLWPKAFSYLKNSVTLWISFLRNSKACGWSCSTDCETSITKALPSW